MAVVFLHLQAYIKELVTLVILCSEQCYISQSTCILRQACWGLADVTRIVAISGWWKEPLYNSGEDMIAPETAGLIVAFFKGIIQPGKDMSVG